MIPLNTDSMRLFWYSSALDEQEGELIHEQEKRQESVCPGRRPQVPRSEQHQTQVNDDQTLRRQAPTPRTVLGRL